MATNTGGQLTEVDLVPAGSDTPVEEFKYSYYSGDNPNAGMVSNVQIFGEASTTTPIQQVAYTYYDGTYDTGPEQFGNLHDLMTATIEDGSGHPIDTTYYRYYTPSELSDDALGYEHGLEYMFTNASYTRLVAQFDGSATEAMSESNTNVAPFANEFLQYDPDTDQVVTMTTQGTGCSVCGDGLGEYQYSYEPNYVEDGTAIDYNLWSTKTVETLPNSSTDTVYTNFAGEVLLSDSHDAVTGIDSDTFYIYDSSGRLLYEFDPSAIASYSLSGDESNLKVDINPTGLITEYAYYTSNTASDVSVATSGSTPTTVSASTATAGGVVGLYEAEFLIDGMSEGAYVLDGTPDGSFNSGVLQDYTQYFEATQDRSIGSLTVPVTVYLVANDTVYTGVNSSVSGTSGAEETTYSYTVYAATAQVCEETMTLPSVSDQPSGGSSDTVITIFDLANEVTVHTPASSEGADWPAKWASMAVVRYRKLLRDCLWQVSTTVRIVSTKRLPFALCVPNDSFRQITAGRRARSLTLLVGSTPSTSRNVHNQSR
jgi:hypothetical protein